MNLAKQFREFGIRNSINPMHRDVQTLYYNVFQLFNMATWPQRLEIETKNLEHLTGMSRKQIDTARNYLIQKGLIIYHKRSGSASPIYELVFLGETQSDTQTGTQTATQTEHKDSDTLYNNKVNYINKTKKGSVAKTPPAEKPKKAKVIFIPPTLEEIEAYFFDLTGNGKSDAKKFEIHYSLTEWKYGKGKTPIKDWKKAAQGWIERSRKWKEESNQKQSHDKPSGLASTKEKLIQATHQNLKELENGNYANEIF